MNRMAEAAARGMFARQHCACCGHMQYPPQEFCGRCLMEELDWIEQPSWLGEVEAVVALHRSYLPEWAPHLPCRIGLVRLSGGAMAVCFLTMSEEPRDPIAVTARIDDKDRPVLMSCQAAS